MLDREAECPRRRAVAESRRPFDLSGGPLARIGLIRLGESEHAVLLTMHHLITDGWSLWRRRPAELRRRPTRPTAR